MPKNQPDYNNIKVPDDKDPTDYTYAERRAEILENVLELGDPTQLSRTKAAERYDVSIGQISQDMDRLGDYLSDRISKSKLTMRVQTAFNKIYEHYMSEGKYSRAWQVIRDWGRFLMEVGEVDKEPDKLDIVSGNIEVNIEGPDDDNDDLELK